MPSSPVRRPDASGLNAWLGIYDAERISGRFHFRVRKNGDRATLAMFFIVYEKGAARSGVAGSANCLKPRDLPLWIVTPAAVQSPAGLMA
jgi:hypothetical protein